MADKQPMMAHQQGDVDWIREIKRGLLANEMGLGKSRSAIEAFDGGHNLIIAPSLIVTSGSWDDQLELWSADPSKWTIATYHDLNQRRKTGKGTGTTPVHVLHDQWRGKWDALVVDEAHYVKGRNTSWTWATEQIAKSSGDTLLMTGTPIPNWAHEVWSLLRLLRPEQAHPGKPLGSFWRWAGAWFDTNPTRFSNGNPVVGEMLACTPACLKLPPTAPCDHYHKFMEDNFGRQWRQIFRDDVLDLPPMTQLVIKTDMDAKQRKVYNDLKKHFMAEVDGEEVLAWSQGALNVMLDKATVSPWLLNPVGPPKGGKFNMLEFDLSNRTRPTLVFAHHRDVVDACGEVARRVGAKVGVVHGGVTTRQSGEAVRNFKAGKIDVLCGSLEMMSEGLNLTVADMAIFVERSFKPSRNQQAKDRIHRMGQTRPVSTRTYITPNTLDDRKTNLLATKNDRQMRYMSAAAFKELL